jgi:DNA-binding CsgD family transcriptional regulator
MIAMQLPEQRHVVTPPDRSQLEHVIPSSPCLPDADCRHIEVLVAMLGETLAAARDTVAHCERALALLTGHECLELDTRACTIFRADVTMFEDVATPAGTGSTGRTHLSITSTMAADAAPCCVTRRETEVVRLIATGRSNKEIATVLEVSVRTIERHITNVYRKIDARGKADATAWAVRQHLV